jgi:hypothetical protein
VRIADKQGRVHAIEVTAGRRVQTVRHGQGKPSRTKRREIEVVGITGLTTYDQYGTAEPGRYHYRRDFQANPINAVVVRQWDSRDYGPGGKTVFLTSAPVDTPLRPFDDYEDRSLIENCCIKASKQQWALQEEGLERRFVRHRLHGGALRSDIEALWLRLFGQQPPAHRLPMISAVLVLDGIVDLRLGRSLMQDFGIEIGAAFGRPEGRVWRIGALACSETQQNVLLCPVALEAVLRRCPPPQGGRTCE